MTAPTKAHSYRFPGCVVRVAAWHGRPDVASIALGGPDAPTPRALDRLLDRLRADGYREALTNAVGPAASVALVDAGFTVKGKLHLLEHDLRRLPERSGRTRRARRPDRSAIVATDADAFGEFWRFDAVGLREAVRATPHAHVRVATDHRRVIGYSLVGRSERTGYVQRLAVSPDASGRGHGRALLTDGMHWLARRGATRALVNTQYDNDRALDLYLRAGFERLPVGLCVLGCEL